MSLHRPSLPLRGSSLIGALLSFALAGGACGRSDDAQVAVASKAPEDAIEPSGGTPDGEAAAGTDAASAPNEPVAKVRKPRDPGEPAAALPDLYDPAIIPDIELGLDADAIAVLSNPDVATKETWVHASFKMGEIKFADVGVRRKGSFSYRALPGKASLKIKLNKWVPGQKVYGLTDLTLNNMVRSFTFLAERLTFHVFRSLGLPAPKANTAHVAINGEDYGIYANVETPNRKFITRVFGSKASTLYEGNWGSEWLPGKEPFFEIDVAAPNAPAGTRPDLTLLFQSVAATSNDDLLAGVAAHLDTKEWLRFAAAEAITAQRDGYAYGDHGSHNYFMAGDTDGKLSLIPWSVDTTLSDRFSLVDAAMPLNDTLFTRCKLGATCWSAYKVEAKSVVDAFEALDLVSLAKTWHDQIDALVRVDPKREISLATYDDWTRVLYEWLAARPKVVRAQLGL
jgi:hypothetical protein